MQRRREMGRGFVPALRSAQACRPMWWGGGQLECLQPTLVTFTCKTEVLSCGLQADLITFNAAPELLAEARADLRP